MSVIRLIGDSYVATPDLRASYWTSATGAVLSVRAFQLAEEWLLVNGWLVREASFIRTTDRSRILPVEERAAARELLRWFVIDKRPPWVYLSAGTGIFREELIPEYAAETLGRLFPWEHEREALLLAAANRFDLDRHHIIGDAGEEAVVVACKDFLLSRGYPELAAKVRRVSLISDQLGYDVVSPDRQGVEHQIEVKCFSGNRPAFFLSRGEYSVGTALVRWALVLCKMRGDDSAEVIGWTTHSSISDRMPQDRDASVRWQVVRVILQPWEVHPGLPIT